MKIRVGMQVRVARLCWWDGSLADPEDLAGWLVEMVGKTFTVTRVLAEEEAREAYSDGGLRVETSAAEPATGRRVAFRECELVPVVGKQIDPFED